MLTSSTINYSARKCALPKEKEIEKMINLNFNEEAKKLGAKWDSKNKRWVASDLSVEEFKNLEQKYFSDLVVIDVALKKEDSTFSSCAFGYNQCRHLCGYVLALAEGRDSGAKIMSGVAVLDGGFTSAGSAKNFRCDAKTFTKVRLKVGKSILADILSDDDYIVTVHDSIIDKQALITEKEKLLARLAEIDRLLSD